MPKAALAQCRPLPRDQSHSAKERGHKRGGSQKGARPVSQFLEPSLLLTQSPKRQLVGKPLKIHPAMLLGLSDVVRPAN